MRICQFGDHITIDKKLHRIRDRHEKRWVDVNIDPIDVIVIGIRNLSNGINDYNQGEGITYEPREIFKGLLVVSSMFRNPFYIRYNIE